MCSFEPFNPHFFWFLLLDVENAKNNAPIIANVFVRGKHTKTAPLLLMIGTTQFVSVCVAGNRRGEVIQIIPKMSKTRLALVKCLFNFMSCFVRLRPASRRVSPSNHAFVWSYLRGNHKNVEESLLNDDGCSHLLRCVCVCGCAYAVCVLSVSFALFGVCVVVCVCVWCRRKTPRENPKDLTYQFSVQLRPCSHHSQVLISFDYNHCCHGVLLSLLTTTTQQNEKTRRKLGHVGPDGRPILAHVGA